MLIYNLFPLLAGPFGDWEPHFKRAADMGFDWLSSIQSRNPVPRAASFHRRLLQTQSSDGGPGFQAFPEQQIKGALAAADRLSQGDGGPGDQPLRLRLELTRQHREWFMQENGDIAHPSRMEDGRKVVWGDLARFNHQHTSDPEGLYPLLLPDCRILAERVQGLPLRCGLSDSRSYLGTVDS